MKLRFLVIGAILSVLCLALFLIRGFHPAYFAVLGVGVVSIMIGLFKK